MSGTVAVSGYNSSLLLLLAQAEGGLSDPTLLDSLIASETQATTQDSATTSAATGSSSDLQNQIQSAVSAALQTAEQSGNTDLKGVVYNTLVEVLKNNGIDPKTLQPTPSTGQSNDPGGSQQSAQTVDSGTSSVLAQVLAALSGASASSNPLAQLTSSQDGSQAASDLLSLLPTCGSTSQPNNNQDLLGFLFDSGQ